LKRDRHLISRTPKLGLLTTSKSLPSASELPIIVAMKMWIGIGAEQDGEQSLRQHCSANPPLPWSPRGPVTSGTPPTKTPAEYFLCRGAACCARFSAADQSLRRGTACCARCSVADERYPLASARSIPAVASWLRFQPQATIPRTSPPPEKTRETSQYPDISTRFWPKSRSYRKHTTKPCLPGSRIAQCDASELPSSIGQPLRRNR
jgi:hypothetical protein